MAVRAVRFSLPPSFDSEEDAAEEAPSALHVPARETLAADVQPPSLPASRTSDRRPSRSSSATSSPPVSGSVSVLVSVGSASGTTARSHARSGSLGGETGARNDNVNDHDDHDDHDDADSRALEVESLLTAEEAEEEALDRAAFVATITGGFQLPEDRPWSFPASAPLVRRGLGHPVKMLKVGVGSDHVLALSADGTVWATGRNLEGQLGLGIRGDAVVHAELVRSLLGIHVVDIAAGGWHSLAVDRDGRLFGWGDNREGQLGLGDDRPRTEPTPVLVRNWSGRPGEQESDEEVLVQWVVAGALHSLLGRRGDGGVMACGSNAHGQCGQRLDSLRLLRFQHVAGTSHRSFRTVHCAAGTAHTILVTDVGDAWVCGRSDHGQLGPLDEAVPGPATATRSRSDPPDDSQFRDAHRVWALRRVALPDDVRVVHAAAGEFHSLFATDDGRVLVSGTGLDGQLGLGRQRVTPASVRLSHPGAFVASDGTCVRDGVATVARTPRAVVFVAAGAFHSFAVTGDGGHLFAWGLASRDRLGVPTPRPSIWQPAGVRFLKDESETRDLALFPVEYWPVPPLPDLAPAEADEMARATRAIAALPEEIRKELTDAELVELKRSFDQVDVDSSGAVDGEELHTALTAVGEVGVPHEAVSQLIHLANERSREMAATEADRRLAARCDADTLEFPAYVRLIVDLRSGRILLPAAGEAGAETLDDTTDEGSHRDGDDDGEADGGSDGRSEGDGSAARSVDGGPPASVGESVPEAPDSSSVHGEEFTGGAISLHRQPSGGAIVRVTDAPQTTKPGTTPLTGAAALAAGGLLALLPSGNEVSAVASARAKARLDALHPANLMLEARRVFFEADRDGSGTLSPFELSGAFAAMGLPQPSHAELELIVDEVLRNRGPEVEGGATRSRSARSSRPSSSSSTTSSSSASSADGSRASGRSSASTAGTTVPLQSTFSASWTTRAADVGHSLWKRMTAPAPIPLSDVRIPLAVWLEYFQASFVHTTRAATASRGSRRGGAGWLAERLHQLLYVPPARVHGVQSLRFETTYRRLAKEQNVALPRALDHRLHEIGKQFGRHGRPIHRGRLDLRKTSMRDTHLSVLVDVLQSVPIVQDIDLRGNHITDAGMARLIDLLEYQLRLASCVAPWGGAGGAGPVVEELEDWVAGFADLDLEARLGQGEKNTAPARHAPSRRRARTPVRRIPASGSARSLRFEGVGGLDGTGDGDELGAAEREEDGGLRIEDLDGDEHDALAYGANGQIVPRSLPPRMRPDPYEDADQDTDEAEAGDELIGTLHDGLRRSPTTLLTAEEDPFHPAHDALDLERNHPDAHAIEDEDAPPASRRSWRVERDNFRATRVQGDSDAEGSESEGETGGEEWAHRLRASRRGIPSTTTNPKISGGRPWSTASGRGSKLLHDDASLMTAPGGGRGTHEDAAWHQAVGRASDEAAARDAQRRQQMRARLEAIAEEQAARRTGCFAWLFGWSAPPGPRLVRGPRQILPVHDESPVAPPGGVAGVISKHTGTSQRVDVVQHLRDQDDLAEPQESTELTNPSRPVTASDSRPPTAPASAEQVDAEDTEGDGSKLEVGMDPVLISMQAGLGIYGMSIKSPEVRPEVIGTIECRKCGEYDLATHGAPAGVRRRFVRIGDVLHCNRCRSDWTDPVHFVTGLAIADRVRATRLLGVAKVALQSQSRARVATLLKARVVSREEFAHEYVVQVEAHVEALRKALRRVGIGFGLSIELSEKNADTLNRLTSMASDATLDRLTRELRRYGRSLFPARRRDYDRWVRGLLAQRTARAVNDLLRRARALYRVVDLHDSWSDFDAQLSVAKSCAWEAVMEGMRGWTIEPVEWEAAERGFEAVAGAVTSYFTRIQSHVRVRQVAAGAGATSLSALVTEAGEVWVWGGGDAFAPITAPRLLWVAAPTPGQERTALGGLRLVAGLATGTYHCRRKERFELSSADERVVAFAQGSELEPSASGRLLWDRIAIPPGVTHVRWRVVVERNAKRLAVDADGELVDPEDPRAEAAPAFTFESGDGSHPTERRRLAVSRARPAEPDRDSIWLRLRVGGESAMEADPSTRTQRPAGRRAYASRPSGWLPAEMREDVEPLDALVDAEHAPGVDVEPTLAGAGEEVAVVRTSDLLRRRSTAATAASEFELVVPLLLPVRAEVNSLSIEVLPRTGEAADAIDPDLLAVGVVWCELA